jgi:anti-sigma regulatory factor (Ser/Thr protein kinase)
MSTDSGIRLMESIVFPATRESVGKGRRWLRRLLDGHPRCDDVVLLLSELLTNSVLHTRSAAVGVVLLVECDDSVQVEVVDEGSGSLPHVCEHAENAASGSAQSGRGLRLLRMTASRWGFIEETPRCVVWFVVDPLV